MRWAPVGRAKRTIQSHYTAIKINITTTGGTIDKIYFSAKSDCQVGEPVIGELLKRMDADFEFSVDRVLRTDSLDLTGADRQLVVDRVKAADSDYMLVTHGTDGMAETAKWLREQVPGKRTLVTGTLQAVSPGVYIAMNGQLFDSTKVRKNLAANRFESIARSSNAK